MKKYFALTALAYIIIQASNLAISLPATAEPSLFLAYPPENRETTSEQIFLIGTASPQEEVLVNGKPIQRSRAGHFAPSFPLQIGENIFIIRHGNEEIKRVVTRISTDPEPPVGVAFSPDSLTPARDISRLPGELICFGAIAPNNALVSVRLGNQTIPLLPQTEIVKLPPNNAVLTAENQPNSQLSSNQYQGCDIFSTQGKLGKPLFQLSLNGQKITQESSGAIEIIAPNRLKVIEITAEAGVARTGPSTNYSRLTPLPKGTRASVTGKEGDWLRLDYGAWIREAETQYLPTYIPPKSIIRSVTSRQLTDATEIIFPLETKVPVSISQGRKSLTLTLYNTTAQTDIIRLDDAPLIKRLDWEQVNQNKIEYTLQLKSEKQWGYELRYEGTSLILSLRHPPQKQQNLQGIKILLDAGHGGKESGSVGPTGYPEKEINLVVSKLLQKELEARGATVYMTRETDKTVSLSERVEMINKLKTKPSFFHPLQCIT